MECRVLVRANSYHDSVSLMAVSQRLSELKGVTNAVVAMGTPMNKELLKRVGLLNEAAEGAGPTDLVIAVGADSAAVAVGALDQAEAMLRPPRETGVPVEGAGVEANLAMISVPGAYAAREARRALEKGLHVMLYSDNVSLADEVALKRLALDKGLLLMGPDCGTAIIDGVGLGFANAVRRGNIGIVAASGTGAQELSCLIDRLGGGLSQVIGTGGRDLSAAVGGLMTLHGLRLLQEDPATDVVAIISKPPAKAVADALLAAAQAGPKPVVVCFLDGELRRTIDETAVVTVALASGESEASVAERLGAGVPVDAGVQPGRTKVVGLFSGGTLCDQARLVLEQTGGIDFTLVDLGDDEFTVGRPHPMIDPTLRRQRLQGAGADPETAVILLDVVLGHGAHPDPGGALAGAIREAVAQGVTVVASVTGTEADPQGLGRQSDLLRGAGAVVAPTARRAAQLVAAAMTGGD